MIYFYEWMIAEVPYEYIDINTNIYVQCRESDNEIVFSWGRLTQRFKVKLVKYYVTMLL
jgi:hypothetical protein